MGAEADAFVARCNASTTLNATHESAYRALIDGLVADGMWAKLAVLYVFASDTQTHALLNLISSSFNGTAFGTVAFTADHGFAGDGSTFYISTNWTESVNGGSLVTNSAGSFGTYVLTAADPLVVNPGSCYGSNWAYQNAFRPSFTTDHLIASNIHNISLLSATGASPNTQGMWVTSQSSGTSAKVFKNAVEVLATTAGTGQAPEIVPYAVFAQANGSGAEAFQGAGIQQAAFFLGGTLTDADAANISDRLNDYMTVYGINVYTSGPPPVPDVYYFCKVTAHNSSGASAAVASNVIGPIVAAGAAGFLTTDTSDILTTDTGDRLLAS